MSRTIPADGEVICAGENQAQQEPYSPTWSTPPIAGVSAPGPP